MGYDTKENYDRYEVVFINKSGDEKTWIGSARNAWEAKQLARAIGCVIISVVNQDL